MTYIQKKPQSPNLQSLNLSISQSPNLQSPISNLQSPTRQRLLILP
ncbi:MAG TPA: hypothetical protein GX400_15585 [Chloroflexi bacterium]|nr:hypothetical protein [Chloroflexota bacterium]